MSLTPTLPRPRTPRPTWPPKTAADQAAFKAASHVRTTPTTSTTRGR